MKSTLGRAFFFYIGTTLAVVLFTAFFALERNQSRQWEDYLRSQSASFARFSSPEILKQFRGSFPQPDAAHLAGMYDFLGFNRDLIRFAVYSPSGRLLFESPLFPDYIDLSLDGVSSDANELSTRLRIPRPTQQTVYLNDGGRLLDQITPAFGPTGEQTVAVRFLISFDSVDRWVSEMRLQFLQVGFIALLGALFLAAGIARRVSRPITRLTAGARAIGQGDLQTRLTPYGHDEIATLARAFNEMADSLQRSRNELTAKNSDLAKSYDELRQVQEQLIRSERLAAIGQLAAGVSHEIDNPIGIILGYSELLLDEFPVGDPRRDDLLGIIEECRRCRRITGGLLGFARTPTPQRTNIDLERLLRDTISSLQPQKLFRDVRITLHPVTENTDSVIADADQLRQIMVNLLLNSAQAMNGSGQIVLSLFYLPEAVIIEVCDTGPGVAESLRTRIFDPYFSTKASGEGTGLGLSLCRKLIEEIGGSLILCPPHGEGACFRLQIPLVSGEKSFDRSNGVSIG